MANTLVIDQGTHATRAILFNERGEPLQHKQRNVALQRLNHVQVEQDAEDILLSVQELLPQLDRKLLSRTKHCALTTQRSTIVAWNRHSGAPLYPAISWQDRRARRLLEPFRLHEPTIRQITGLPLSAHYGAGKMCWLLQHLADVDQLPASGQLCIAPLGSFLLNRLLAEQPCLIDHSNAHRTLLFDIRTWNWSPELTSLFHIPEHILPRCCPVIHDYGRLAHGGIPVTAVCGDQTAALYGHGLWQPGSAFINLGSGAFVLSPLDRARTEKGLLCSVGKTDDRQNNQYLLEATVNGAGAALSWLQHQYPVTDLYARLAGWLLQDAPPPPLFINTVGGLGSPWWQSGTPPYFKQLRNQGTVGRYIAVIESIVFLLVDNIRAMQQQVELKQLYVSGGLSRLDGLCQRLADLAKLPVHRLAQIEATARGAAWLANGCPDDWPQPEQDRTFSPLPAAALEQRYRDFNREISRL